MYGGVSYLGSYVNCTKYNNVIFPRLFVLCYESVFIIVISYFCAIVGTEFLVVESLFYSMVCCLNRICYSNRIVPSGLSNIIYDIT